MNNRIQSIITIRTTTDSIKCRGLWRGFFALSVILACFVIVPWAQALNPPPDGGYTGFNTAEGQNALFSLTTGAANTAAGWFSLKSNTDGSFNTGVGAGTLLLNVGNQATQKGIENTAVGAAALLFNDSGSFNTGTGVKALFSNTTGINNTAIGIEALSSNTTGSENTAVGAQALFSNTTGGQSTAIGDSALYSNVEGLFNTGIGFGALGFNTSGSQNTATGYGALFQNNGNYNSAFGTNALTSNTEGLENTAIGADALGTNVTGNGNSAFGNGALHNAIGSFNTALGDFAGSIVSTGSNIIAIGVAVPGVSTGLGELNDSCYIANIHGQPFDPGGAPLPVSVDNDGKLGTMASSRRFKHDIQPMEKTSEAILSLKPVTYHYNIDKKDTPQFGLVAEDVAEVNPDLVVRDKQGQIYSVRYEAVNAMLLNEFLKEHRTVEELKKEIAALAAIVKEQAAQIEKVSTEFDTSKNAQLAQAR